MQPCCWRATHIIVSILLAVIKIIRCCSMDFNFTISYTSCKSFNCCGVRVCSVSEKASSMGTGHKLGGSSSDAVAPPPAEDDAAARRARAAAAAEARFKAMESS